MAQLVSFNQGLFSAPDILLLDNKLSCVNRSSTLGLVLRTGFYSGISNASVLELGAPWLLLLRINSQGKSISAKRYANKFLRKPLKWSNFTLLSPGPQNLRATGVENDCNGFSLVCIHCLTLGRVNLVILPNIWNSVWKTRLRRWQQQE